MSTENQSARSPEPPLLKVRGLGFRYPKWPRFRTDTWAIREIGFSLEKGTCLGLLGANGSGKSTLLACLGGTLAPIEGEVWWRGKQGVGKELERELGILPEAELPFPNMKGERFLTLTARLMGLPWKEAKERCRHLMTQFGILEAAKKPHGKYSKGMKRRLGLAVALLLDPPILLLDEPLSGMDPIGVEAVRGTLLGHRERKGTAIVSTHQLEELEDLFDKILVLDQGRIVGFGTVQEVLGEEGRWTLEIEGAKEEELRPLLQPLLDRGATLKSFGPSRQALGRFLLNLRRRT